MLEACLRHDADSRDPARERLHSSAPGSRIFAAENSGMTVTSECRLSEMSYLISSAPLNGSCFGLGCLRFWLGWDASQTGRSRTTPRSSLPGWEGHR